MTTDTLRGTPDVPRSFVWATVMRFATVALFFDSLIPLLPSIGDALGLSDAAFQVILGADTLLFALVQAGSPPLIARLGLFRSIAISSLLVGFGALAIALAHGPIWGSAAFLSLSLFNGVGSNATRVTLRELTSAHGFKRLLARVTAVVEIKQIFMPALLGVAIALCGWRVALLISVTPVVLAGCWTSALPSQPSNTPHRPMANAWRMLLNNRSFVRPTLALAGFQLLFAPLSTRLPFILAHDLGFNAINTGIALSVSCAATAIGLFSVDHFAERWSSQRLLRLSGLLVLIGLAFMILASALHPLCLIAGIIIVQAALGPVLIPCTADAIDAIPSLRIEASGLFGLIQTGAAGLATVVAGGGSALL